MDGSETERFQFLPAFCFVNIIFICLFVSPPSPAIIENIAEFRPEICGEAAQQGLLQWLLKRIKVRELCNLTSG